MLEGADGREVTIDLMRYHESAPTSSMEYVHTRAILWARGRGAEWLSVGVASLAGLEIRPLAPLWTRFGAAAARIGDPFYHCEGLRD